MWIYSNDVLWFWHRIAISSFNMLDAVWLSVEVMCVRLVGWWFRKHIASASIWIRKQIHVHVHHQFQWIFQFEHCPLFEWEDSLLFGFCGRFPPVRNCWHCIGNWNSMPWNFLVFVLFYNQKVLPTEPNLLKFMFSITWNFFFLSLLRLVSHTHGMTQSGITCDSIVRSIRYLHRCVD